MPLPDQYARGAIVVADPTGRQYEIIVWYIPTDPVMIDQSAADSLADAIDGGPGVAMRGNLTADCSYVGSRVALSDVGVVWTSAADTNAGVGVVAGDELPSFNAVVIRKQAGVAGRRGRGRWFVPLVPETLTDENVLTIPGRTAYETLRLALVANLGAAGGTFLASHYSRSNATILALIGSRTVHLIRRAGRREVHPLFA